MSLCFVTGNKDKLEEISELLAGSGVSLRAEELDLVEIQGTSEEVARAKSESAYRILKEQGRLRKGEAVLVDDVSLRLDALKGAPGPYAKDFMLLMGRSGVYELCEKMQKHGVVAECALAMCNGKNEPVVVIGKCPGRIVSERGSSGFGFDPIFEPLSMVKTFAEMTDAEKAAFSHRGLACRLLREALERHKRDFFGP